MTYEELGALLRSEREKKKRDITDVANQLKINPRQLRAIEDGDVSSLPHPTYARGFIRSYGALLGFDQDEIQEMLDSVPGLNAPRQKKRLEKQGVETEKAPSSHTGLKITVLLCLLAAGLYYLWDAGYLDFIKDFQKSERPQSSELQSADSYMAAKDAEKARKDSVSVTPPPPVEESRGDRILPLPGNQPIPAQAPPEPEPVLPQAQAAAEESATAAVPEVPEAAPSLAASPQENPEAAPPGQHKLIITAVEECWIHSNADKTDTRQFSLRKGDTFALTFADSLELKLGNAGGVRLRYDGSDLPPPGNSGQVRTLTFPPKSNS